MKRNLLLTTATILMLGTGVAMAQGTAGSATQQNQQMQQQNSAASPNAVGDKSSMSGAASLDSLMGKDVYGADGKKLGSIDDIIIDPQSGQVKVAVLERGGILGIGGKSIALDYTLIGMEGDRLVAKQVTEEQAQAMPEFTYEDNMTSLNRNRNGNQDHGDQKQDMNHSGTSTTGAPADRTKQ